MAYYDALISAWNTGTLPANTTGTPLTGLTTANKLIAINGWVHTGTVPATIFVTGAQVANCINWAEFAALTTDQKNQLLALCSSPGPLLGGSANTTRLLVGMLLSCFANNSATIANLTALAVAAVQPWWQFAGYTRAFDMGDVTAAGLS